MTTQHTPETIRALLDGITAGEWAAEVRPGYDGNLSAITVNGEPIADFLASNDAAFIAASPGIARYALELAAALGEVEEALRAHDAVVAERDEMIDAVTAENERMREIVDEALASMDRREYDEAYRILTKAALAPQPARTDGVVEFTP